MAKHRLFEPGTERLAELTRWFRVERLSGTAAYHRAQKLGWPGSRALYKNEHGRIMGPASFNADIQARAVAEGRLPPGGAAVGPAPALVEASVAPVQAPAAPAPAPEVELDPDPKVTIRRLIDRQFQHGLTSQDPASVEKVLRTATGAMKALVEMERQMAPADACRVFIYLPSERPDPHEQDPNDPASWPVRAAA